MIERTTREAMFKLLEQNPTWKVIDLASSTAGWKYADIFTDIIDRTEFYKKRYGSNKKFIKCDVEKPLPFKDKEFDFVIASHILEHVKDPENFLKTLMRIGKQGYIEIPTPLFDNLVNGPTDHKKDPYGHKWWITFDDGTKEIVYNPKLDVLKKSVSIQENNQLMCFFRDSIITGLYWKDKINFRKGNSFYEYNDNRDLHIKHNMKGKNYPRPWRLGRN